MANSTDSAATIGFENELWRAADALCSNMDAAEYKHVVLGLIFLKYISDAFEEYHARPLTEVALGADPGDPDGSAVIRRSKTCVLIFTDCAGKQEAGR